jgi:hypothetical protein
MKKCNWITGVLIAMGPTTAMAQPPGGAEGGGRGRSPIMEVLDADHNGIISEEEIKNASRALASLDKDKDGKLSEEEYRPMGMSGARGPWGQGQNGNSRGPGMQAGFLSGGFGLNGFGPAAFGIGGPSPGPAPERDARGGPNGGPPINADRMLNHAMQFDSDKDGKLNKDELQKFIAAFVDRHGNQGGPDGPRPNGPPPPRDDGPGRDGGPGRDVGPGRDGGRPDRDGGPGREGGRPDRDNGPGRDAGPERDGPPRARDSGPKPPERTERSRAERGQDSRGRAERPRRPDPQ